MPPGISVPGFPRALATAVQSAAAPELELAATSATLNRAVARVLVSMIVLPCGESEPNRSGRRCAPRNWQRHRNPSDLENETSNVAAGSPMRPSHAQLSPAVTPGGG